MMTPGLSNQLSQINLAIELLNRLIAFASGCFQILAPQNPNRASRVIDDFCPLQARRHAHARPVGNQPRIRKIEEVDFSIRFVKQPMVRQGQKLQVQADRAKFIIGNR